MSKTDYILIILSLVVVLSHGKEGQLYSSDSQYPTQTVWEKFAGDSCATLLDKPKLFFIQVLY